MDRIANCLFAAALTTLVAFFLGFMVWVAPKLNAEIKADLERLVEQSPTSETYPSQSPEQPRCR